MAPIELEAGAIRRAGRGPRDVATPVPSDGSPSTAPVAPGARPARLRALASVWGPVVLKAVGIVLGMLALAAIGASSIARGSGVPVAAPSARSAAGMLPGVSPPAATADAGSAEAGADAGPGEPSGALTTDGKVILNRAGADELRRIPGVGPKRAQAIIELRTKLGGRFKRLSELLRVKGIGLRSLKKMEPYVVLDPPAPPA